MNDISSAQPLLPLRRLSNFVYCKRLFYLQWVENLFKQSSETIEGTSLHERVNTPTVLEDQESPAVLRSLALESENLGITGVVDYVEQDGEGMQIIEYKRGSAHRNENDERQIKDWDLIQLIGQNLLLKEHGHNVSGGAVYYAADRRRVRVGFDAEKEKWCLDTIDTAKHLANSNILPPPTDDNWKCNFCSAYPICLPFESKRWNRSVSTCSQKGGDSDIQPPRAPMADNDEREVLVVQRIGSSVGKKGDQIIVSQNGEVVRKLPQHQLRGIYLYGPVQISAQAIASCVENRICISHFSSSGKFLGNIDGLPESGVTARIGQYDIFRNPERRLELARAAIRGKIHNQRTLLMRNGEASKESLDELKAAREKASNTESLEALLGIEGNAAAVYFRNFNSMLKGSSEFDFTSRNRRPPRDPINALLSLAYSCLVKEITGVITSVGLDPYFGFYHQPRYGRPALALDLMEEFRPLIADSVAITIVNRSQLDEKKDFLKTARGTFLTDSGRKVFWEEWFRRLDTEVKHPVFGYTMSYRRMLEIQARLLWRVVRGEATEYIAFTVR